jgi:FlgD Ig-like domain
MKKNFFILALLSVTFVINAQVTPDTLWTKTFGSTGSEYGIAMQQTYDNGFILVGNTGYGLFDIWLIKTDELGNEEWNQTFGGSNNDYAHSIMQTSDFGYIIAGSTSSYGAGESDGWLLKIDENGIEEWNQTFGQEEYDGAFSVQQTIDGGYIITGYSFVSIDDQTDSWLIKTDEFGNEEWSHTFGGNADDQIQCVQQTSDNGFILTGSTRSYGSGSSDAWLIKTDEFGNEEWNHTFGGSDGDFSNSVQQTIDGGYVLTGYTNTFATSYSDAWLIKTDELGIEEWSQVYDSNSDEETRSVLQTNDGGFIIAGCTNKFSYSESDIFVVKTDASGNEDWRLIYGDTGIDRANSILQISDNDFAVLGFTQSTGSSDFWFLRLGLVTGINNSSLPDNKIFMNNFPNPFNPSTIIEFSIQNKSKVELIIFNIKGQKINTLAQSELEKGSHSIIWNGEDKYGKPVCSGIYYYMLNINGKTEAVKKCLLLK